MKKHLKSVGLLLTGIVVGITISFAPDIQAATSKLLGSKVAKVITVKKDGEVIGEGGIINGTTYLPVRTVVNSVNGIEVGSVSSSEVNLVSDDSSTDPITNTDLSEKAKQEEEEMKQQDKEYSQKHDQLRSAIRELNDKINTAKYMTNIENTGAYQSAKSLVKDYEKNAESKISENDYKVYKAEYDRMNKEKQEAETNLPIWEKELADLQAQLAELQK